MHINETGGIHARNGIDTGRAAANPASAPVSEAGTPDFGAVFDAVNIRSADTVTNPAKIPDSVWADVERASQLVDTLASRGQAIRFNTSEATGRVVAGLFDLDGNQLQPLALTDLIPDPRSRTHLDLTTL
jgi:hypothetical protein